MNVVRFDEVDGGIQPAQKSVYRSVDERDEIAEGGMEGGIVEGMERLDEMFAAQGVS